MKFSPIKELPEKPLYKQKYFRILISILTISIIVLFIALKLPKEKIEFNQIFQHDKIKEKIYNTPNEETRIGIKSILIFMTLGALILGFKKGTFGITIGTFIGATVGMFIAIFVPEIIYLIEWSIYKIFSNKNT